MFNYRSQVWTSQSPSRWPEGWSWVLEALCSARSSSLSHRLPGGVVYHRVQTYVSILTACLALQTSWMNVNFGSALFSPFLETRSLIPSLLQVFVYMLSLWESHSNFSILNWTPPPYPAPLISISLWDFLSSDIHVFCWLIIVYLVQWNVSCMGTGVSLLLCFVRSALICFPFCFITCCVPSIVPGTMETLWTFVKQMNGCFQRAYRMAVFYLCENRQRSSKQPTCYRNCHSPCSHLACWSTSQGNMLPPSHLPPPPTPESQVSMTDPEWVLTSSSLCFHNCE